MTRATKANLAASVAARLLNRARETGDDYQTLLTSYCLERFLYRLSISDRRNRFVLKGAMLLRLWSERPYRATLDLDLLRRGDGAFDAIRGDLQAIVTTPVPPDAVESSSQLRSRATTGRTRRGPRRCAPSRVAPTLQCPRTSRTNARVRSGRSSRRSWRICCAVECLRARGRPEAPGRLTPQSPDDHRPRPLARDRRQCRVRKGRPLRGNDLMR